MDIQKKLVSFAFEQGCPYIARQPGIRDHLSGISFILVGSAATGLCTEGSDADICLLCAQDTFDAISAGTRWADGRPTETILDGTQLHYYAISTDTLAHKIDELDDLALYVYGSAIVIADANGQYRSIAGRIHDPALRARRSSQAMDMLGRRKLALHYALESGTDPMARLELCAELMRRLLMCVALYDGREYDPRKRLYQTALPGAAGTALKPRIDAMFLLLGEVCTSEDRKPAARFLELFDLCFAHISQTRPTEEAPHA